MQQSALARSYFFLRDIGLRHWPLLFFLIVAAWATIFSIDRQQSINTQLPLLVGLFLYILIVDNIKTTQYLRAVMVLLSVFAMALVFLSLHILLLVVADKPLDAIKTLDSLLLVVPNDILLLAVVMPLLSGAIWNVRSRWIQILSVCCIVVALVTSEILQSRQAVALLLLGQICVVAMMRPRWAMPAAVLLLAVGVLLDGLSGWRLAEKIFLFPRTYVWHTAWVMFLDRPWVGQGPGLFGDIYFAFLSKAGYVLSELSDRRPMLWAHNLYLEQLAERGIGGLLALLGLLGASALYAWRAWRKSPNNAALAAGILTSVLMLALSGIAEASLSRIWVAVLLLVLAALSVTADALSQEQPN